MPCSAGSEADPAPPPGPARIELAGGEILGLRAPNPSPFTLDGTNSWLIGHDPVWLVDPGPSLESHVEALTSEIMARGGLGGIALTHDHPDHSEAVPAIRDRFPDAPLGACRGGATERLQDGARFGPLKAIATPGHSSDHLAFAVGKAALTGDAVLGIGSSLIIPYPGALAAYLESLERLRRRRFEVVAPGHGPPVFDVEAKLEEYVTHRRERERRLLAALGRGRRTVAELLDDARADAPAALRPAAEATLAAHLDKLADEGRLPPGVERPRISLGQA